MNNSLISGILGKIMGAIVIFLVVDLAFVNWWIVKESKVEDQTQKNQEIPFINMPPDEKQSPISNSKVTPTPIPSNKADFGEPSPKQTIVEKTIVEKQTQTIVQTAQKEIFIPMGSSQTKSNSFSDLSGVEVTIDTTKYSTIDYIVFEASIWVDGGNGKAWAQLKNVNDNNPIIESQITSTSGTAAVKTSSKIPFPYGAKTYRVQAKTDMVDFAANVSNARLKIVLK